MKRSYLSRYLRNIIVTRKYIMLTFAVLIILTVCLINNVQAKSSKEYSKVYLSIEIGQGDTLSSIAERYAISSEYYNDYIEELRYINNLKNDTIYAGCYLLIPIYKEQ